MGYYDEDYDYNEEEYYDEDDIIEDALEIQKKRLVEEARKHLKKEVQDEINSLKSELNNYKKIKEQYDEFTKEKEQLAERKEELEEEYQNKFDNLEREFYRKKINDLIPDEMIKQLYYIGTTYIEQKKCPLCDENREYTITTPDGEKHKIPCKCKNHICKYFVTEAIQKQFRIYKSYKSATDSNLFLYCGDDYLSITTNDGTILDKFDEKNIPENMYRTFFTSKEEAQKYADFLNKKYEEQNK